MGKVTELVVTKGRTMKAKDREEWTLVEYSFKANIDHHEEIQVAKVQLQTLVDSWLANVLPSATTTEKREVQPSLPRSEDLSQLPWKSLK